MEGFMSKHLIKILSICALIVLVPLIIVGSALCVTEASPVTLTVYEGGETYENGDYPTLITVQVEDEAPTAVELGQSITVKKNSSITLTFTGNTVYQFDGWYRGTDKQVTADTVAEELSEKYEFTIRGNTNITAIKNIKKFDIVYAGYYDDQTTPIDYESDLVNYGDALYTPTSVAGASFEGWYIEGEANTTLYTSATFDVANKDENHEYRTITLMPKWSNQMTISYYDSDETTLIHQDILTEVQYNSYELLSASAVADYVTPGYEFNAWIYNDAPITDANQIGFEDGVTKYLVLSERRVEIAEITYYAPDGETVIAQVNLREDEFASSELLSAEDERVLAQIPSGYTFNSWLYEGSPVETMSQIEFVDGRIDLVLSVSELPSTTITYYTELNGAMIAQTKLYEDEFNSYALLTADDNVVKNALTSGYSFVGWTTASGSPITKAGMVFGQNYEVYIDKDLINYNVNVQFNAVDTDQVTSLNYNVENGFSTYTITRDGYEFVGFVYNNNTYTANGSDYTYNGSSLGDAVVENNGLTVTALWDAAEQYGDYIWTYAFGYENNSIQGVYVENNGNYTLITNRGGDYEIFEDVAEEGYAQLEDVIIDEQFQDISLDNLYVRNGDSYVKANVTEIRITVNNYAMTPTTYEFGEGITYKEIMDTITALIDEDTTSITLRFMCTVA